MPELPEVETVRSELASKIIGHKIINVQTDWPKTFRNVSYNVFKKTAIGLTIKSVERKGKFLFFRLSNDTTIVAHLRMTGHFIVSSCWNFDGKKIIKQKSSNCKNDELSLFQDKKNIFIHSSFTLDKNLNLLFSDVRKFGTIDLLKDNELLEYQDKIGTDALDKQLDIKTFSQKVSSKNQEIKKVLLNQTVISGVGNIYADEILFKSRISPKKNAKALTVVDLKHLLKNTQKILKKAIASGGTSFSDFRNTEGKKGNFGLETKVYQKKGLPCPRKCGDKINRIKLAGRGTYFCPSCQK